MGTELAHHITNPIIINQNETAYLLKMLSNKADLLKKKIGNYVVVFNRLITSDLKLDYSQM